MREQESDGAARIVAEAISCWIKLHAASEEETIANDCAFTEAAGDLRESEYDCRASLQNICIVSQAKDKIMQPFPEFKASDFSRLGSDLFDAAIRSPVAIAKHRKPKFA